MQLNFLIEKAASIAGSEYKLAKMLGYEGQQRITNWKRGDRPCPPEDQALMAAVAGMDPVQVLIDATLEKNAGKEKGQRLTAVLQDGFNEWRRRRDSNP